MDNAFFRAMMLSGVIFVLPNFHLLRCWNVLDYTFIGA
jgi:hypothetical protein